MLIIQIGRETQAFDGFSQTLMNIGGIAPRTTDSGASLEVDLKGTKPR